MSDITYTKCHTCPDGYVTPFAREKGYTDCWDCIEKAKDMPCFACDDPSDPRSENGQRCAVCEYRMWLEHGPEGFVGGFDRWQAHVELWRERAGFEEMPPVSSPIYAKQERVYPTPQKPQPITELQFAGMYAVGLIAVAMLVIF